MALSSLGSLLQKRFQGSVGKHIADAVVCDTFDACVEEWWQGRFRHHVRAKYVRDHVLFVEVDHSLYAQEIKGRQSDFLNAIHKKVGRSDIRKIVFVLG